MRPALIVKDQSSGWQGRRPRRLFLGSVLLVCSTGVSAQAGITLHTFTTPPANATGGPIGFAYAGNKFVGTTYNGGFYSTDLNGGNVQDFGPANTITGNSVEHFVAASSGYGAFANRDIYVGQDNTVIHVANDGSSKNIFTTLPTGEVVRGILFDTVGTFHNDMIVSTSSGHIYEVTGAGTPTLIASLGQDTEGLDIAPTGTLGQYSGRLLVASEGTGQINAIDPTTHSITTLFTVPSAEEISVVPLSFSGNPVEGFSGANFSFNVQKGNASQFAGLGGTILVTGETTNRITDVSFNGTIFTPTDEGVFANQPEDGIFVTAAVVNNPVPEPATMASGVMAVVAGLGLAWHRRRRTAA